MKKLSIVLSLICGACVSHEFPVYVNCGASSLSFQIKNITHATDCDTPDGAVSFTASGGVKPYTFSVDGVAWSMDSSFQQLRSSLYIFLVKDAAGCTLQIDSVISSKGSFLYMMGISPDSECVEDNGRINISIDGNTDDFQFRIDKEAFSPNPVFEGLKAGDHTVFILNSDGCIISKEVNVPREATGISWQNDILPILTVSCANQGCHDGVTRRDWRNYNEVKTYAQAIKSKTRDRSMPFDKTLPDDQIEKISCWVDDGALNN
jgi:hypothetical protein